MEATEAVDAVAAATTWDARIALVRRVPEEFGTSQQQSVYADIARRVYVPHLAPDFAFVHWREEYELPAFEHAYAAAAELTAGFTDVATATIAHAIRSQPKSLRVFRVMLGLTAQEFAAACGLIAERRGVRSVAVGMVKSIEAGRSCSASTANLCAGVVDEGMRGVLFGPSPTAEVRVKTAKPDTIRGWATIEEYATSGVPLAVFLHQRHYGGAFRQLLDATSTKRGNLIEDAVEALFESQRVPFLRTGSVDQEEIVRKFGLTIKPAPDFVLFDTTGTLRAILECKGANDGGTARDKAARFRSLRGEATRLGGVPVFAVLAGLGWTRAADALGPVVRDTDGRVFTLPTLSQMLETQPLPSLTGT